MRRSPILLLALVMLDPFTSASTALAAFAMSGPGVSPAPEAVGVPPRPEPTDQARPATRPSGPPVAYGFGHQVPLSFAVRQIVPKGVKVSFGQHFDAETIAVDWKGGRPWPDVLRSTLRPLGLHVTFRPGAVLITRGPGS